METSGLGFVAYWYWGNYYLRKVGEEAGTVRVC